MSDASEHVNYRQTTVADKANLARMLWQKAYDAKQANIMNKKQRKSTESHRNSKFERRSGANTNEQVHRRTKRSNVEGRERNVETLVVVDSMMNEYYSSINMDVRHFVLTILNMVSVTIYLNFQSTIVCCFSL